MKKFLTYPALTLRRMLKNWPAVFLTTLLLAFAVGLVAWQQLSVQSDENNPEKFRIGVVGNFEGSYLGFGYYAVTHMDSSYYTLELIECTEEEAISGVENGSLTAYVAVPDGFVTALSNGENLPVRLVLGGTQAGLGAQLIEEVSSTISSLISDTEAGIYGVMDFYAAHGQADKMIEDGTKLNVEFLTNMLRREELYTISSLNDETGDLMVYYIAAALVLLVLFFGMNGASLLLQEDMAMTRLLKLRGLPVVLQCLSEYLAYAIFHLAVLAGLLGCLLLGALGFDALTGPAAGEGLMDLIGSLFSPGLLLFLAAAVLCLSALHFLLFSGVSRLLEGLLLSFVTFAALGYLSGLFYPISFFPKTLRVLASFLPTNAAREGIAFALDGILWPSVAAPRLLLLLVWGLIFLAGGCLLRIRRCRKDD